MLVEKAIAELLIGKEKVTDVKVFHAIISDLAPECVKDRKVLRATIDENIFSLIIHEAPQLSEETKARVRYILAEEKGLSDSWINITFSLFERAFTIVSKDMTTAVDILLFFYPLLFIYCLNQTTIINTLILVFSKQRTLVQTLLLVIPI